MRLSDSHVHLHAYRDVDGLIERTRRAGVEQIVGVSVDLATSCRTIEIARRQSGVVAAVGFHPCHLIGALDEAALGELETLAVDPTVGFIGEIGLDSVDARTDLDQQRAVFVAQLELAQKLELPVNLHLRGAFDEAFAVLEQVGVPEAGAVVHYFVGDAALAHRALDLGLNISVGKPVTRESNARLRQAITTIPLNRLLLETDSYPLPGRKTEPADVVLVAEAIANILGRTTEDIAEATTANLLRLLSRRRYLDVSSVP